MKRLVVLLAAATLAGCGGGGKHVVAAKDVERAFRAQGLVLHPLPSSGAEQPAMGETSPCAKRYAATTPGGALVVSVCDNARAAAGVPGGRTFRRTRDNVVAEYAGNDESTRRRIDRALSALD